MHGCVLQRNTRVYFKSLFFLQPSAKNTKSVSICFLLLSDNIFEWVCAPGCETFRLMSVEELPYWLFHLCCFSEEAEKQQD